MIDVTFTNLLLFYSLLYHYRYYQVMMKKKSKALQTTKYNLPSVLKSFYK